MSNHYQKWNSMNELETIVTKFSYIKDMSDCIYDASERHDWQKIQSLCSIINEYTQLVLDDWDVAFATAWSNTIGEKKETPLSCTGDSTSQECKDQWNSFWDHANK
jgi:hypothetical protein